jgi:hypothetical protein
MHDLLDDLPVPSGNGPANLREHRMNTPDRGLPPAHNLPPNPPSSNPAPVGNIRALLGGNPFLYIFHFLLLRHAGTERSRVSAVEGLGRSGSALASAPLLETVDDPCPSVRKKAVEALGIIRSIEAVPRLLQELEDGESDVRCESAEALGRIGDKSAVPSLLRVLNERDPRLRSAAVSALGQIGGDEVRTRLLELFTLSYDTAVFPAFADSLSRLGVREIVEPVMQRLGSYESIVYRLQLLNSVCRALGAGNTFYRILSRHEYARVDEVNRLIKGARAHIRRSPLFRKEPAANIERILASIASSYRNEDRSEFLRGVWEFMASIQLIITEIAALGGNGTPGPRDHPDRIRPAIEAVNRFLQLREIENIRDEGMVFLVICIVSLISAL